MHIYFTILFETLSTVFVFSTEPKSLRGSIQEGYTR